jgi:hypothetical protein
MKNSAITIGLLAALLGCGRASAAETTYGAGAQALPLQQEGGTARAMGMGSAVVGVEQGSASLFWNPAGLGYMSSKEVGLHHNSGLGGAIQEIAVFGTPLGGVEDGRRGGASGGLAVSVGYVNYGSFAGTDEVGRPNGFYSAADYSGSVGWGKALLPRLSAGVALKLNHSSLDGKGYDSLAADIGLLWDVIPDVHLGLGYNNLGLFDGRSGARLASGLRLGAGWDANKRWLLAASTELQGEGVNRLQLGTEYRLGDVEKGANVLTLRGGYQLNFPDAELGALDGLTLGLGFALSKSASVDYAMLPAGDLGTSHRLSLTLKFDVPVQARKSVATAKPAPEAAKPAASKKPATRQ